MSLILLDENSGFPSPVLIFADATATEVCAICGDCAGEVHASGYETCSCGQGALGVVGDRHEELYDD